MKSREKISLRNCIKYIEEFKKISGIAAKLDKTNVIPCGKFFNQGNKICHELEVNWTNSVKLIGLKIDKQELIGQYFDKAHVKAQNIISYWKAKNLLINGKITVSKCLIISQ